MQKLLTNYSVQQIVVFLVLCALAIKGLISFFDWSKDRLRTYFSAQHKSKEYKQEVQKKFEQHEQSINTLKENQIEISQKIQDLNEKISLLIASDRDDIKSALTREHHYFCYQVGWIDDYSLQCCEKRFEHYKAQKGNSFIEGFMKDLRNLPKRPPQEIKKEIYKDANSH